MIKYDSKYHSNYNLCFYNRRCLLRTLNALILILLVYGYDFFRRQVGRYLNFLSVDILFVTTYP